MDAIADADLHTAGLQVRVGRKPTVPDVDDHVVAENVVHVEVRQRIRRRVLRQVVPGGHDDPGGGGDYRIPKDDVTLVLRRVATPPEAAVIDAHPVNSIALPEIPVPVD